jgi:hypothetical protein
MRTAVDNAVVSLRFRQAVHRLSRKANPTPQDVIVLSGWIAVWTSDRADYRRSARLRVHRALVDSIADRLRTPQGGVLERSAVAVARTLPPGAGRCRRFGGERLGDRGVLRCRLKDVPWEHAPLDESILDERTLDL